MLYTRIVDTIYPVVHPTIVKPQGTFLPYWYIADRRLTYKEFIALILSEGWYIVYRPSVVGCISHHVVCCVVEEHLCVSDILVSVISCGRVAYSLGDCLLL